MTTSELDQLIALLGKQRFINHEFRVDRHGPEVLGFVRNWGDTADVVILFDNEHACAYRTPTGADVDVFAPEVVSWWYGATPVWTLRAMIALPQPGHPDAPTDVVMPPAGYALSKDRFTMRVRMRRR